MTDAAQLSERQIKALQIAATSKLTRKGKTWLVPSQAGKGEYKVTPDPKRLTAHARTSSIATRDASMYWLLNTCSNASNYRTERQS